LTAEKKVMGRTTAIAGIIIALLIGLGIGVAVTPSITGPQVVERIVEKTVTMEKPVGLTGEVLIGALLPLTGDLASYGENSRAAVEIAVGEVNAFLKKSGALFTIKLVIEDTETKPAPALDKLTSMNARGIKLVVGPQTSAEVRNIKGYADANKILLISQSSTAPDLSIPGDFVYRFCPADDLQAPAIARVITDLGVKHVVSAWRGDAWGDGLNREGKKAVEKLGGVFHEGPRYAPEAKEFSAEVRALADQVQTLVNQYGADKVGVYYVAFAEAVTFMTQAADYPVLARVRWFGSDGTALLDEMAKSPPTAEFSQKTKMIHPIFWGPLTERLNNLLAALKAKLGRQPDSYAFAAYDAVWVLTYALLATGKYDAEAVRAVLPQVAASYSGALGGIVLNEGGDLAAANYALWVLVPKADKYEWIEAGAWMFATDSISWVPGFP